MWDNPTDMAELENAFVAAQENCAEGADDLTFPTIREKEEYYLAVAAAELRINSKVYIEVKEDALLIARQEANYADMTLDEKTVWDDEY